MGGKSRREGACVHIGLIHFVYSGNWHSVVKQLCSSEKGQVTQGASEERDRGRQAAVRGECTPWAGSHCLLPAGQRDKGPECLAFLILQANLEIQTFLACLLIFKYGQVIQSFKKHGARLHWRSTVDRGTWLRAGGGGRGEGLSSASQHFSSCYPQAWNLCHLYMSSMELYFVLIEFHL